ncbi:MAG: hypothetical protein OXH86_04415 [Acidimicrobiaceae bacterium]|nr:hypothetical protein [Acidimicrobiaceae bacterium]MDE0496577.1 hypothetical protein [Acidimicrobiaceae bacterium]
MTTHEFCLFVDGADLTVASTVERLECAGYTHPATAACDGVHALVFSRSAERLADAVTAVVAATEDISGLFIAREARSGAVPVFDPASLELAATCVVDALADSVRAAPRRARHRPAHLPHADSLDSES